MTTMNMYQAMMPNPGVLGRLGHGKYKTLVKELLAILLTTQDSGIN